MFQAALWPRSQQSELQRTSGSSVITEKCICNQWGCGVAGCETQGYRGKQGQFMKGVACQKNAASISLLKLPLWLNIFHRFIYWIFSIVNHLSISSVRLKISELNITF